MKLIVQGLPFAIAAALITGCSAAHIEAHQDKITKRYVEHQRAEQIRHEARHKRTDVWFDQVMGHPVNSDTGLKMP